MTHVNVTVPRAGEIEEWKRLELLKAECQFWAERAASLRTELENLFDHAEAHGHVEIWSRGKKLDLYCTKAAAKNGEGK